MGSGILELVQQTEYDQLLNGNPEVTFFKKVFYRYTPFSRENIIEYFDDEPQWGSEVACTLSKAGDMLSEMFVGIEIDATEVETLPISFKKVLYPNVNEMLLEDPYKTVAEVYISKLPSLDVTNNYFTLVQKLELEQVISEVLDYIDSLNINNDNQTVSNLYNFNLLSVTNPSLQNSNSMGILMENLLELFDSFDIFRLYILLDYISTLQTLTTYYVNNTYDKIQLSQTFSLLKNHEFNKLTSKLLVEWIELFAHFILKEIVLEVGGNVVDKYDCHYYNITMQLTKNLDSNAYQEMIYGKSASSNFFTVYIPLQFWFNKQSSYSLPCVALKYHEVKIKLLFNELENLVVTPGVSQYIKINKVWLYSDYMYLTKVERTKFTTSTLEYLIQQNQVITKTINSDKLNIDLNFFHPCKEIFWICHFNSDLISPYYFIPSTTTNPILSSQIYFNNHAFSSFSDISYYSQVQPYETHSRTTDNGISLYSFSLFPENSQPSGSVDISYIPSKYIKLTFDEKVLTYSAEVRLYATNYNILKISNGFARLLFE